MNERIKELLIKAQEQARTEVEQDPKFKPPYLKPATEVHVGLGLSYEKFALLIVTECKSVLLDMINDSNRDMDTLDIALTVINDKFGVEE